MNLHYVIFVGATEAQMSENLMTTSFLSRSMDTQLKNFLDAEANLVLSENNVNFVMIPRGVYPARRWEILPPLLSLKKIR